MPENRRKEESRGSHPRRWLDDVWRAFASRWAISAVLGAWVVVLLVCAWVPQEGMVAGSEGRTVARWMVKLQADRPALGNLVDRLGLVRVWGGWVVRILQGFTAGWLALLGVGEMLGWLAPGARNLTERHLEANWDEALRQAERVANAEGWRLARTDDDVIVIHARKLKSAWRRALVGGLWLALLLLAVATWVTVATPGQRMAIPLVLGSEAQVGRWGIDAVRLERLEFRPRSDGAPRDLAGDVAVSLNRGATQEVRVVPGRITRLGEAVARVVGVGPVLRVTARSLAGGTASLAPMSGIEAKADVLRVRLGGINQEHLIALDDGRATLRLVEGATSLSGGWAVLGELLDGYTGASLGREALQPPDTMAYGDYEVALAPEFYLQLQIAPRLEPISRAANVACIIAVVLALVSLIARWRWHPESAVLVLSPAGSGSRCAFLASPAWEAELASKLGCEGSEESA